MFTPVVVMVRMKFMRERERSKVAHNKFYIILIAFYLLCDEQQHSSFSTLKSKLDYMFSSILALH